MADAPTIWFAGDETLHRACVLAAGVLAGWLIGRDARAWPLPRLIRMDLLLVAGLGGMLGSALPALVAGGAVGSAVQSLADARADALVAIGAVALFGPKTVIGGLIGAFLAIALFKRLTSIDHDTSDAFARGTCVLMAIGRLGCVAQQCCFGAAVPAGAPAWYGVDLGDGVARHPTQMLELSVQLALAAWIFVLHARASWPHRRLFVVFVTYGLARVALEALREPLGATWAGLNIWQWLGLMLAAIGAWQLVRRRDWQPVPAP